MRVLHLLKTSVGAMWALRQMRELVKLGIDVHVALPDGGPLIGSYSAFGATEHLMQTDFPARSPCSFPKLVGRFRQLVHEVRPDIIHSHFVGTTLTMRLALGRKHPIPRVFQVPGPLHLEHGFFRNAEIATAAKPDYWVGSCKWTCERYRKSGIIDNQLFLSYYGVDFNSFERRPAGILRKELGLSQHAKIIGMVAFMYAPKRYLGQLRGLKGHEDLIDAMAFCLERIPDAVCVMVGGAWNGALVYEKRVREYGVRRCGDRVIFLGTRYDVSDLYRDFDVVVHPSLSENVGGAVESLLNMVPTITTNVGGFPDVIRHGETGWLVPPANPQRLSDMIVNVLGDLGHAREIAARGRALAADLFDVRRTAAGIAEIYQKILFKSNNMRT